MVQLKFETEHDRSFDGSVQTLSLQISRAKVSVSFGGALVLSGTVKTSPANSYYGCFIRRFSKTFRLCAHPLLVLMPPTSVPSLTPHHCFTDCLKWSAVLVGKCSKVWWISFLYFLSSLWLVSQRSPLTHLSYRKHLVQNIRPPPPGNSTQLSSGAIEKFVFGKFDMKRVQTGLSFCRGTLCTRSQWGLEPLGLWNNMWARWGWTRAWIK